MLNYNKVDMRYEPYPLAILRPALDDDHYKRLTDNFPDERIFDTLPKYPYKLSLSEKWAPANYEKFLRENREWNAFHGWVKSDDFIRSTLEFLAENHINLDVDNAFETPAKRASRLAKALLTGKSAGSTGRLNSRFEFSVLKADGGVVTPHTDAARKMITLVVSMVKPGEWDTALGGGLDMNRATDPVYAYNWNNRFVPWEKTEIVETIPFVPNQCIMFIKTHNSLHSVRKMEHPGSKALRKSITVVIERDD